MQRNTSLTSEQIKQELLKGFSYRLSQEHSCRNVFIKNLVKMGNGRCLPAGLQQTQAQEIFLRRTRTFSLHKAGVELQKNCQTPKIRREAEEDSQVPVSTLSSDHIGLLTLGFSENTLGLGQPLHGMAQCRKLLKTCQNPGGSGTTEPPCCQRSSGDGTGEPFKTLMVEEKYLFITVKNMADKPRN